MSQPDFNVPPDKKLVKKSLIMMLEGILISTIDKAIEHGIAMTNPDIEEGRIYSPDNDALDDQHRNILKALEGFTAELNVVLLHVAWVLDPETRKFFMAESIKMKKSFFEKAFEGEELKPTASLRDDMPDYVKAMFPKWKPFEIIEGEQEWKN